MANLGIHVLGLDIGGANLKVAHSTGAARLVPFELWRQPDGLADAIRGLLRGWPPFELLAVTMTGELCDCFPSKRAGVLAILDAVDAAAGTIPVRVWRTDGWGDVIHTRNSPLQAAAANWLALAWYAARHAPKGSALVIDIGSTTTDITPLYDGRPVPRGRTDPERLRSRELVYTGVRRTPLCALLGAAGAAEWFATTLDIYLIQGAIAEYSADLGTADGRPATQEAAHARLARMLCADLETSTAEERQNLADRLARQQAELIHGAVKDVAGRLPQPPDTLVLAGSGEFLARAALHVAPIAPEPPAVISLADTLGAELSQTACAYAVAILAREANGERSS